MEEDLPIDQISKLVFSQQEVESLLLLDSINAKRKEFLRIFTRREANGKAWGIGLADPTETHTQDVNLSANDEVVISTSDFGLAMHIATVEFFPHAACSLVCLTKEKKQINIELRKLAAFQVNDSEENGLKHKRQL